MAVEVSGLQALAGAIAAAVIPLVFAYLKTADGKEAVAETVEYYTTGNAPAPATVVIPPQSYQMKQVTKDWILQSETPADKISILEQIEKAEAAGKTEYTIKTSRGYYDVEWGALIGSGKFGQ
jgi:hypothetical protein